MVVYAFMVIRLRLSSLLGLSRVSWSEDRQSEDPHLGTLVWGPSSGDPRLGTPPSGNPLPRNPRLGNPRLGTPVLGRYCGD